MGASPDGIVVCSCHGTGVCEIKVYTCALVLYFNKLRFVQAACTFFTMRYAFNPV